MHSVDMNIVVNNNKLSWNNVQPTPSIEWMRDYWCTFKNARSYVSTYQRSRRNIVLLDFEHFTNFNSSDTIVS